MLNQEVRNRILRDYPKTMSKEQFYKLCKISKNHARILLTSGVVPCQINNRATHKYVIATADVIAYLESQPSKRKKSGSARMSRPRRHPHYVLTSVPPDLADQLRKLYNKTLAPYPDVMDCRQISDAIDYSDSTINKWCVTGKVRSFTIGKQRLVPKPWLIDFMLTPAFLNRTVSSRWHQRTVQPVIERWMTRQPNKQQGSKKRSTNTRSANR